MGLHSVSGNLPENGMERRGSGFRCARGLVAPRAQIAFRSSAKCLFTNLHSDTRLCQCLLVRLNLRGALRLKRHEGCANNRTRSCGIGRRSLGGSAKGINERTPARPATTVNF